MVTYKWKVVHVESDKLYLFTIRQISNVYPSKDNNCGDEYNRVIQDDRHLCDTAIPEDTYLNSKINIENRDLVLSSLQIEGAK